MGFQDLHSFNLAMLAKQCWRLLNEPESLCAKVLRAKYYPDGDILNARLRNGASLTWQSIHAGIQTFKRGCIWRVGNGEKINIWSDPWIPSSPDRKIMASRGSIIYIAECPCVATAYLSIFYRKYKYMHEIHVEITM
jgi:hypothetical protein